MDHGLVAEYSDSDEFDPEPDDAVQDASPPIKNGAESGNTAGSIRPSSFFSLGGGEPCYSSSEEEEESAPDEQAHETHRTEPGPSTDASSASISQALVRPTLPKPRFPSDLTETKTSSSLDNRSIFHNPYLEEEIMAKSALQKHVSMTDTKQASGRRERKTVCKNFKKGYCAKGDKCIFMHTQSALMSQAHEVAAQPAYLPPPTLYVAQPMMNEPISRAANAIFGDDPDDRRRKKRVGVTDSLVPPKKALKAYHDAKANAL